MGSFIMDKASAPACKVYHAHCKEVKDWPVFARNVPLTSGSCISAVVVDVCAGRGRCITAPQAGGEEGGGGWYNPAQDASNLLRDSSEAAAANGLLIQSTAALIIYLSRRGVRKRLFFLRL